MPLSKEQRARYPKDWALRSRFVRCVRARHRCEWCGAENHQPHPVTGSMVVLTCAHVFDHRPEAASLLNLAALCNYCHLRHDAKMKAEKRARNTLLKSGQLPLFATREEMAVQAYAFRRKAKHQKHLSFLLHKNHKTNDNRTDGIAPHA